MAGIKSGAKLGRTSAHRKALHRNMASSLIKHEEITTTLAKGKSLKRFIDKMVSVAKKNDLNSKRKVMQDIKDRELVKKLFETIAPRYTDRAGGYVRIIKLANRFSDNSEMCIIKFIA